MATIQGAMLTLLAMAALTSAMDAFGGDDNSGLRLIGGLCAAVCMLGACRAVINGIL